VIKYCTAVRSDGKPCKNRVRAGRSVCYQHGDPQANNSVGVAAQPIGQVDPAALAGDPKLSPNQLRLLARSDDLNLLLAVAEHPNAPSETLARILVAASTAPLSQERIPPAFSASKRNAQMCRKLWETAFSHPSLTDEQRARITGLVYNEFTQKAPSGLRLEHETDTEVEDDGGTMPFSSATFKDLGEMVFKDSCWPTGQGSLVGVWAFSDGWYVLAEGAGMDVYECGYYEGKATTKKTVSADFKSFLFGKMHSAWDWQED